MRDDRSSTDEPRTPVSATSSAMFRRAPLPAVKGTMGGIESPRRELFSPAASTLLVQHTMLRFPPHSALKASPSQTQVCISSAGLLSPRSVASLLVSRVRI
ncbi:hypothetical protein CC85DRAFT_303887 [Cutaneotrichosporon oleaginosum]|uniref:Uncharacterized protein n=1 Tax=Cutaneotrichosporon oleaginosum TaxID=879819 RepID=A0A0J1AZA5_9TREE|nr:uncharacterized protein CC85DRAFT_303887 [Cutaneotrichosporon oleaginosum]KLT40674.1 hypothetical protein CC85DRAFT_303887 [Cutaneotrichosporon oleaginosum]TXT14276.1 hypothetical protein COLE_00469 [Cutaneotrichosporon oleaginosum]